MHLKKNKVECYLSCIYMPIALKAFYFTCNVANRQQQSASCLGLWKRVGRFAHVVTIGLSLEKTGRAAAEHSFTSFKSRK